LKTVAGSFEQKFASGVRPLGDPLANQDQAPSGLLDGSFLHLEAFEFGFLPLLVGMSAEALERLR
jgi:hypothetical protein